MIESSFDYKKLNWNVLQFMEVFLNFYSSNFDKLLKMKLPEGFYQIDHY